MNYPQYSPYLQNQYQNSAPQQLFQYPQQQQMYPQQQNNQLPFLNGKLVDSIDVVRATEVPIGGYGIFPRADLTEIYIKSWNSDGTTKILTFKPYVEQHTNSENIQENEAVLNRLNDLDKKIEKLIKDVCS